MTWNETYMYHFKSEPYIFVLVREENQAFGATLITKTLKQTIYLCGSSHSFTHSDCFFPLLLLLFLLFSALLFESHIIHLTMRVLRVTCVLPLWHFHLNIYLSIFVSMCVCALARVCAFVFVWLSDFSILAYVCFSVETLIISIISATSSAILVGK